MINVYYELDDPSGGIINTGDGRRPKIIDSIIITRFTRILQTEFWSIPAIQLRDSDFKNAIEWLTRNINFSQM
ncbi:hypothetical protein A3850_005700 [Lewinella sp. 4G2]|nr:hypothetical protein A3850_005700 [Lewinella sp. 4G2]